MTLGRRHLRGQVLIFTTFTMVVLVGFVSLAVDFGRAMLVRAEMQSAADMAAMHAASYLTETTAVVRSQGVALAAQNNADGVPVAIDPNEDIEIGQWNSDTGVFTVTNVQPDAVRITVRRTAARNNPIDLTFGVVLGKPTMDIEVTAIARLARGKISASTMRVQATMNPWLAGMPDGDYGGSSKTGTAPENSPIEVTEIAIVPGETITMSVTGSMADTPENINQNWTPDGQPNGNRTNKTGYLNGMSQLKAQQGSLVGVFLNDNPPTHGSTPAMLNMSSASDRDYASISPDLKQPFYIGDALRDDGVTPQQIVVPAGATRLFFGMHDNTNWSNNGGYFWVTVNGPPATISIVD